MTATRTLALTLARLMGAAPALEPIAVNGTPFLGPIDRVNRLYLFELERSHAPNPVHSVNPIGCDPLWRRTSPPRKASR